MVRHSQSFLISFELQLRLKKMLVKNFLGEINILVFLEYRLLLRRTQFLCIALYKAYLNVKHT